MQSLAKLLSLTAVQTAVAIVCVNAATLSGAHSPPLSSDNVLWYNDVAGNDWVSQGLPIGNGHQAAMVRWLTTNGSNKNVISPSYHRFTVVSTVIAINSIMIVFGVEARLKIQAIQATMPIHLRKQLRQLELPS
jgi:hypothetical protein